jgi:cytidylate kinase
MIGGVALFVISGVSASGKSTVARLLAEQFERGVCVPGDAIRAMMVSGRVEVRPNSGEEALRQLTLRYAGGCRWRMSSSTAGSTLWSRT